MRPIEPRLEAHARVASDRGRQTAKRMLAAGAHRRLVAPVDAKIDDAAGAISSSSRLRFILDDLASESLGKRRQLHCYSPIDAFCDLGHSGHVHTNILDVSVVQKLRDY